MENYEFLVCIDYMHPGYQTSIFGKKKIVRIIFEFLRYVLSVDILHCYHRQMWCGNALDHVGLCVCLSSSCSNLIALT